MATLKEKILELLKTNNGLSDREITNRIFGEVYPQQSVNQACNGMNKAGIITRKTREDGKIGNYTVCQINIIKKDLPKLKSIEIESKNYFKIGDFSKKIITLGEITFNKTKVIFEYFNKCNIFVELKNKTVLQTLENKKYSKLRNEMFEKYNNHLDTKIGDFLIFLKNNNDSFYKKFLNPYGDGEYCKFMISDQEVIDKKGLYLYKLGEEVLYIGRCRDSFKKRFNQGYGTIHPKNCYLDGQSTNCHINSLINKTDGSIELFVAFFTSDSEIENNERRLIHDFKPKWNVALKS
ncbi:GIY-YIG nuclease family protein [Clostridium cadaveris]